MDNSTIFSLIGTIIAVGGLVGGFIVRDRALHATIVSGDEKTRGEIDTAVRELNVRISTQDERINGVNDRFVRRDDMLAHFERLERTMETGQAEQRETNKRIDLVLATLAGAGTVASKGN